jgi:NADH-quinone oxidoreductase subunit L
VIQKGLLKINNALAFIDMGLYDRYVVDGMEFVNRVMFTISKTADDVIVDGGVDFTGKSVKAFNVILRTIQSGKIQVYFIMIVLVLTGYIWKLSL